MVHTQLLVGADGANSMVAHQSGIRRRWTRGEVGFCLETTLPLSPSAMKQIDTDLFEFYFLNIPLGYGWVFPKTSAISLGIGGALAHLRRPQDLLLHFSQTVAKLKQIPLNLARIHAHLTPAGGFPRRVVTDRVMLAGDAAGFIDPLVGEGIYYAIKSGQLAATACQQSLEHNDGTALFLNAHYARTCADAFGKDLRVALDLTYRIHTHFDLFFDTLKHSSSTTWVDLATGKVNYRTLRRRVLSQLLLRLMKQKLKGLTS
jgi:flavin-dependent dehydrogenase